MSPAPLKKSATYADLLALPENVTGQIIDGDLYAMPRPAPLVAPSASSIASVP